ncbi:MAG: hypothetical protein QXL01_04840 [Thermoplasmatales archaeon]
MDILKISAKYAWSNSYGLARTLIALATAITLIFNSRWVLFKIGPGILDVPKCDSLGISLFCLLNNNLLLAQILCIGVLLVIASGWRPKYTALFHWWISYSFSSSVSIVDGGDHIATILTTLLIPVCLTDERKWHWKKEPYQMDRNGSSITIRIKSIIAQLTIVAIQVQIAAIYLHAAIAKISVTDWTNGTVLYYWFNHPVFGAPLWLSALLKPIVSSSYLLTYITWGVMLFELCLFSGLFMSKKFKAYFLTCGISFHFGIFLIHGLFTFFLVMAAALILYLRPLRSFDFASQQVLLRTGKQ